MPFNWENTERLYAINVQSDEEASLENYETGKLESAILNSLDDGK